MTSSGKHFPVLDEIFGVGTFYRRIGMRDSLVRGLHAVGDGTIVCAITVEHNDFYANPFTGIATDEKAGAGGLPPPGSLTTVGAGDRRFWQPDTAIGTLNVAASATVTGGVRTTYSNQPAPFSRVVIVTSVGGRLCLALSGLE